MIEESIVSPKRATYAATPNSRERLKALVLECLDLPYMAKSCKDDILSTEPWRNDRP